MTRTILAGKRWFRGSSWFNRTGRNTRWSTQEELADDGFVDLPAVGTSGGFGFSMLGNNEEYALFSFTSAGVVTLIQNSTNVTNADTDANFNIFASNSVVRFKNRLGADKKLFTMVWCS